jgi:hypothetical protein
MHGFKRVQFFIAASASKLLDALLYCKLILFEVVVFSTIYNSNKTKIVSYVRELYNVKFNNFQLVYLKIYE